jgi:hypothetical protein
VELPGRICDAGEADAVGWDFDYPYPGSIELTRDDTSSVALQAAVVRLRVSPGNGCIERVLGSVDPYGSAPSDVVVGLPGRASSHDLAVGRAKGISSPGLAVTVFSARTRFPLRCWAR